MSKLPEDFIKIQVVKDWPMCPSCGGDGNPDIMDFCPPCYNQENITPLQAKLHALEKSMDILRNELSSHTVRMAMKRGPLKHICSLCGYSSHIGLDTMRHIEEAHDSELERPPVVKKEGGAVRKSRAKDVDVEEEAL